MEREEYDVLDLRPICPYDLNCYRTSKEHLQEMQHPSKKKLKTELSNSSDSHVDASPAKSFKNEPIDLSSPQKLRNSNSNSISERNIQHEKNLLELKMQHFQELEDCVKRKEESLKQLAIIFDEELVDIKNRHKIELSNFQMNGNATLKRERDLKIDQSKYSSNGNKRFGSNNDDLPNLEDIKRSPIVNLEEEDTDENWNTPLGSMSLSASLRSADEVSDENPTNPIQYLSLPNTTDLKLGRSRTGSRASSVDEDIEMLNQQQRQVINAVLEGKNVFFTGSAGTGKSFTLEKLVALLKSKGKSVHVTASTGIAASNVKGITIHSWSGIGLGEAEKEPLFHQVRNTDFAKTNWKEADVLIVDEISMISGELFEKLSFIGRRIRNLHRFKELQTEEFNAYCDRMSPFGGIQMVLVGDFFQLPPVYTSQKQSIENENLKVKKTRAMYCFESQDWKDLKFTVIELNQVFRQSDKEFVSILNELRLGKCTSKSESRLNNCRRVLNSDEGILPTLLYPTNRAVEEENEKHLLELPGEEQAYKANDTIFCKKFDYLKNCIAPKVLKLRKGAQVMLTKNINEAHQLTNGSRGVVVGFCSSVDVINKEDKQFSNKLKENISVKKFLDVNPKLPIVQFKKIKCIVIPEEFSVEISPIVRASRIQMPLKLAWAVTIHKSQGLTLDSVKTDLSGVFLDGQAYVALSRVKNLEGLQLLGFSKSKITASRTVLEFDKQSKEKD